jgi:hypothetical protein
MKSFHAALLLFPGFLLFADCARAQMSDDVATRPPSEIRAELKSLLLADVEKAPKPQAAPAAATQPNDPSIISMDSFVVRAPPLQDQKVGRAETNVERFFRTGVLVCAPGNSVTSKLTVGPCEGGQLLNLKFVW